MRGVSARGRSTQRWLAITLSSTPAPATDLCAGSAPVPHDVRVPQGLHHANLALQVREEPLRVLIHGELPAAGAHWHALCGHELPRRGVEAQVHTPERAVAQQLALQASQSRNMLRNKPAHTHTRACKCIAHTDTCTSTRTEAINTRALRGAHALTNCHCRRYTHAHTHAHKTTAFTDTGTDTHTTHTHTTHTHSLTHALMHTHSLTRCFVQELLVDKIHMIDDLLDIEVAARLLEQVWRRH